MRLTCDLFGAQSIKGLSKLDYMRTRQRGSHVRLTRLPNGEHQITVPLHDPLRAGTLASISAEVANHHVFGLGFAGLEFSSAAHFRNVSVNAMRFSDPAFRAA